MHALSFGYEFRGGLKYIWLYRFYSTLLYYSSLCFVMKYACLLSL